MNTSPKNNRQAPLLTVSILLSLILLSGCETAPDKRSAVATDIDISLMESREQSLLATSSRESNPATAPSQPLHATSHVETLPTPSIVTEPRFNIEVTGASARSFFMSLVKGTSHNMVVHPAIEGNIDLSMKQVTLKEVMETVRNIYGYEYIHSSRGFEILPSQLHSQMFKVDYLNVNRAGSSQLKVSSGQVSNARSNSNESSGDDNNNSATAASNVSGSQIHTTSDSQFWSELSLALNAIVGSKEERQVVVNPQSGIVIVRAMPAELRVVSDYLRSTQRAIHRQVILEAKILEVELNDGFQSGINWFALGGSGNNSVIGQFGGATVFENGVSNLQGQTNPLNPNDLTSLTNNVSGSFGGVFAANLNFGDFSSYLEFLESQGSVHVLSSPRISTVNNQKAVIKVGHDEFFVTDIDTETQNTTGNTSKSIDVELTPFFSGVALDVIPQISEEGLVTLHIHPSVSEVLERVKQINLNNEDRLSLPLAYSTIRESDSIVKAASGQVVVIGGLMQNQARDEVVGVPLLSSLPFIGGFFQHTKKVLRKSELVILLRPWVVEGNDVWQSELQRIQTSFANIELAEKQADERDSEVAEEMDGASDEETQ